MRTHFMMYGYNPTYDAPFIWWIGEDGSRLPTVPTYEGEGADFGITTLDNWVLTRWPDRTTHSLEEFGKKFSHIEPLLASRYDDIVHRHEGMLIYVEDFEEYKWVILEDLPGIYGQPRTEFKPSSNEFHVRMPWGYCGNEIFNQCSGAETAVTLAERANAAAFLLGGKALEADIEDAWKNLLVAQHHDIQICGLLMDSRKYLPASFASSARVKKESMEYLSAQFATKGAFNLVVYNTHSFDIAERVEIEVPQRGAEGYLVSLGSEEVPSEARVYDSNRRGFSRSLVSFEARVPANTIQVYHVDTRPAAEGESLFSYNRESGILDTPLYSLTLNEGGIRRLYDKETGALLIDSSRGHLFSGVIEDTEETSQGKWSVTFTPNSAKAVYGGFIGGIPLLFEMEFFGKQRRIDCKARFTHNGEKIGGYEESGKVYGFVHENKLRFVLQTRLGQDSVGLRDLPYVIAETDDPIYIQGNYWAARKGADFGIALFNRGCRGTVAKGAEFSLPLAYANHYIWGTRMLFGESTHEFAVYPFAAGTPNVDLHKAALSYHYPPLTAVTGEHSGPLSVRRQVLDIKGGSGVIMTALYPEAGAVILRSCEYQGITETYEPGSADGKLGEQVSIMNKAVEKAAAGKIGPWEIQSHRIYHK